VIIRKDYSRRIASDRDQMIEIKWTETIIQSSATAFAVSNYQKGHVYITLVDLKTRRQSRMKTFVLDNAPTKIYQIDDNNMLFGTEGGKIEHWIVSGNDPDKKAKKIYHAHPESDAGISAIIELKTHSGLLRGKTEGNFKLIATASEGAKEFRIWKLQNCELMPYLKIETTFTDGIKYLLETQETQLAAANEKTIKFYDFIDKDEKDAKEKLQKDKDETNKKMKEIWNSIDVKNAGKLNQFELRKYFDELAK